MTDMNQLIAQWNTEFMYLVPFLKNTLESGLAYDMLKETFERIPVVNRIIPAKNIAVPCLEGIVLNTDNEILQNNFIAMLEKSMDKTKLDLCHPAFPKILGQLSVDEIMLLYYVNIGKLNVSLGRLQAQIQNHNRKFHKETRELLNFFSIPTSYQFYIDHLEILGLLINSKNSYGMMLTQFGEQFLKACLNERSEELIKEIINKETECNLT